MNVPPQARVLNLTRRFKAPRERVFAAFSSTETMCRWFGPDDTCCATGELDFRVGGRYRLALESPKFGLNVAIGTYLEILPPAKIVFTWKWDGDEDWNDCESTITVTLEDHGAETEMHFHQIGFPNDESMASHEHGWNGSFERLERELKA